MIDTNYLTPDEARAVFDEWMAGESRNFMNPDNARFLLRIDELSEGRKIISGLIL